MVKDFSQADQKRSPWLPKEAFISGRSSRPDARRPKARGRRCTMKYAGLTRGKGNTVDEYFSSARQGKYGTYSFAI